MIIPKDLSYTDFLDKVGFLQKANGMGKDILYGDLHDLVIERLGGQSIDTYKEFMDKCGNLGNLYYWDLYRKLYPDNKNVKNSAKKNAGGTRRNRRKSRSTRRNK